jgi:hypothetical protein
MCNAPGLPPSGEPRTPDIIVPPNLGVVYAGSPAKQDEDGCFAHDDTNVILLVSNPDLQAGTVTSSVETIQVAPTLLQALGLDPGSLHALQKEGTPALIELQIEFVPALSRAPRYRARLLQTRRELDPEASL